MAYTCSSGTWAAASLTGTALIPSGSTAASNGLYLPSANTPAISANSLDVVRFPTASSAVNYFNLTPAATGAGPTAAVAGSDTNVDFNINGKGTGTVKHTAQAAGAVVVTIKGAASQTGDLLDVQNSSGTVLSVIDASGNVGIGKTSAGSALDVKGTLRLSGATSGYVGISPAAAAGSTTYTLPSADGSNGQVLSTNGSGTLSWATAAGGGGSSQWTTTGSNIYYTTGSVGIGTTSPAQTLDVSISTNSNIYSTITAGGVERLRSGFIISQGNPVDNIYPAQILADSNGSLLLSSRTNNASGIQFYTNSATAASERMRIASGGNVGIGTISPGYKLDVNGQMNAASSSGTGGYISTGNYGGTGTAAYFPSGVWSNGSNAWIYGTIYTNGATVDTNAGTLRDAGGGWVRTYGATGWYNGTYGGGWYMADTTWVRSYSNKSVYTGGYMRADSGFQVSGYTGSNYGWGGCGYNFLGGVLMSVNMAGCGYDIAEAYGIEEPVMRGEIVSLGNTTNTRTQKIWNPDKTDAKNASFEMVSANLRRATADARSQIMGAVSTAPLNVEEAKAGKAENRQLIALNGHVPVRMTLDGGDIKIGDPITISTSTPGAGMKAATSGRIVGYALEPFDAKVKATKNMVEVFIHLEEWRSPDDEHKIIEQLATLKADNDNLRLVLKAGNDNLRQELQALAQRVDKIAPAASR